MFYDYSKYTQEHDIKHNRSDNVENQNLNMKVKKIDTQIFSIVYNL